MISLLHFSAAARLVSLCLSTALERTVTRGRFGIRPRRWTTYGEERLKGIAIAALVLTQCTCVPVVIRLPDFFCVCSFPTPLTLTRCNNQSPSIAGLRQHGPVHAYNTTGLVSEAPKMAVHGELSTLVLTATVVSSQSTNPLTGPGTNKRGEMSRPKDLRLALNSIANLIPTHHQTLSPQIPDPADRKSPIDRTCSPGDDSPATHAAALGNSVISQSVRRTMYFPGSR